MKAVSVKQPWAGLIAAGEKTIETRTWSTDYRGEILIVSSKKPNIAPAGCALAVVTLVDCRPMLVEDEAAARRAVAPGAVAWVLENIRRLKKPFPVSGRLGLFDVDVAGLLEFVVAGRWPPKTVCVARLQALPSPLLRPTRCHLHPISDSASLLNRRGHHVSEAATPLSVSLPDRQQAYLLHQLANAPDGKLGQSEADKATPTQLKKELQFTPAKNLKELRRQLVTAGLIVEEKAGRVVTHSITDAGRQRLGELERYIPLLAAKGSVNPPADDGVKVAREVYILDALARAQRHTISKVDLDAGFGTKPKAGELAARHPDAVPFRTQECLRLNAATARAVLTDLALRDDVQVSRAAGSESYKLTPAGAACLARLRAECPVLPPTGKPTPAPNEAIALAREAFILLKLLEAPNQSATSADGDKLSSPKPFKLNHATAWQVRRELVRHGHLAVRWDGKEGSYTLTPSGKRYLAALSFDTFGEFKIKGHALTQLLAAAREARATTAASPRETSAHHALTTEHLESAVMDVFHELLRGPFATLRMVPIHEVRREIAKRFETNGVSHAAFNDAMLDLRRTDRVRLVSIDDRSRATPEQLRDSVFAVGETFFYMEKPSGPAAG